MIPLKKFDFSFSSTLIKIIICLSCKGVVVVAVYQKLFNLVHWFFENRSLIQNMSEIGTPPLYLASTLNFQIYSSPEKSSYRQSGRDNLRSRYISIAGNSTAQNLRIPRSRSCVPRLLLTIFLCFIVLPHLTNKLITKYVISQFLYDEFKNPSHIKMAQFIECGFFSETAHFSKRKIQNFS